MTTQKIKIDGEIVNLGEYVCFKNDVEMCGKLVSIDGPWLKIEVTNDTSGDTHIVSEHVSRCWVE